MEEEGMSGDEVRAQLAVVFQKVLGPRAACGPLRDDMKPGDLEGWDSVAHVTLIIAVEKEFKVKFKGAEIARTGSVGELVTLILAKMNR
jgi:acyl carrier protein